MAEANNTTVTLQVHRFTPRTERAERARGGSPFARKSSPFGGGSDSAARRRPRGKQWVQEYTIPARPEDTVLDCLLTVKRTVDPTLAFRYSCGHGMCGSDAVSINGTPTLLCTATIRDWAKKPADLPQVDDEGFRHTGSGTEDAINGTGEHEDDGSLQSGQSKTTEENGSLGVIELAALPGFPPQRDLIADIDPMLDQIRRLTPYLEADGVLATTSEGKVDAFEYLQHPEQLAKYETLSNCIACGVCEGACPVFAGGDAFIGPAALIWASRFINDSRDDKAMERMDAIDTADGVAACQSVRACSRHCPRGIDVGEEMWQIVAKVRER
ncbi:succinate dehydrogenase/fumarate reductase iron-sulfur subunit [Bifidobacterium olomucense]|uniref:succinate dehydrogenase n=1 Tax=Bifidobacterium olomucense TaxID=2675324 RepID=A0A7Y0EWB2_9BIFI|nr:2Fe-2S iron-sulfur cluster-binding protein [Bifidobacterium sp. DSM 109959]NMM97619.1 (2Fe-2S)-binding protein [Bifidobacterium sp. DSM 109959]